MITRYDFMAVNKQLDGKEYPDVFSFPLKKFRVTKPLEQVLIKEEDYLRPDLFFFKKHGNNNMEDIQLWLNMIPSRRDMLPGTLVQLPANGDMNSFYIKHRS